MEQQVRQRGPSLGDLTRKRMTYGFVPTVLGDMLIALGDRGITALMLGGDHERMEHDFLYRFPGAVMRKGDSELQQAASSLVEFVRNPRTALSHTFDLQGALCRTNLWNALTRVPPGEVATYIDIGAELDALWLTEAMATECSSLPSDQATA